MNIEWLDSSEFWRRFDAAYAPSYRLLEGRAWFEQPYAVLCETIPTPGVAPPADEDASAGPAQRWFAAIADHLVVLTWYERESDLVEVAYELTTTVADQVAEAMRACFSVEVTRDPLAS
jgi:hypothetical protein